MFVYLREWKKKIEKEKCCKDGVGGNAQECSRGHKKNKKIEDKTRASEWSALKKKSIMVDGNQKATSFLFFFNSLYYTQKSNKQTQSLVLITTLKFSNIYTNTS